ncbi:MAG: hypothetical protein M2R45_01538 [Verrucomicrobia subdivision 3 bacterium]|nr:hypothetical protein [Limisphaerales bacterium]MCS1413334.1 hypothetical protein [Limisphaerales bacterium]
MTTERLVALFKRAYFSVSLDEDGDLCVGTDDIRRVFVIIYEDYKLLRYFALFGLWEKASLESKRAFVNKMNDKFNFVRFSVFEDHPNVLVADYYLPFEEGIPAFQIVSALRLFSRLAYRILREYDEDDLVK